MDNLARDVKAAMRLGYGVHYGRYKADYPNTADHSVDVMPERKNRGRTCPVCGKKFIPRRRGQCYCNDECRIKYNREKEQKKVERSPKLPQGEAECPICGSKFIRHNHKKVYCSCSCSAKARERKKRETSSEG